MSDKAFNVAVILLVVCALIVLFTVHIKLENIEHAKSHIMTCKITKHKVYVGELVFDCKHGDNL